MMSILCLSELFFRSNLTTMPGMVPSAMVVVCDRLQDPQWRERSVPCQGLLTSSQAKPATCIGSFASVFFFLKNRQERCQII